ncbi:MAG TPA: winged helix-turn-helix domain-containing protein [Symbiobacteriaceae bacterium]|nr:winged helix-turn-helix domain-containing protein [Symbiobacteriaceae bacterium]
MEHAEAASLDELSQPEQRILMALDRRAAAVMDMSAELDLSPAVLTMYLRRLQSANLVQVCEQRFLGNQVQKVYGLVPGSRVLIRAKGGVATKMLQFCSVLTNDVREHIDDKAPPGSFTAGMTIVRIPRAALPEVMERINQLVNALEVMEDKEHGESFTISVAIYPRIDSQDSGSEGRSEA